MDAPATPERTTHANGRRDAGIRLDALPIAALLVSSDGVALDVNRSWTDLSGLSAHSSRRHGWLATLEEGARPTALGVVQRAFLGGNGGGRDLLLTGPSGRRWTRWWSGTGETDGHTAVVLVADVHDDVAEVVDLPVAASELRPHDYSEGSLRSMRDHPSAR